MKTYRLEVLPRNSKKWIVAITGISEKDVEKVKQKTKNGRGGIFFSKTRLVLEKNRV
ncbi:MAG: hypothetical protein QMD50_02700 [Patescibacteria group bacterium]|nr:hypothetical protein [Patescibacteria group bacterium]